MTMHYPPSSDRYVPHGGGCVITVLLTLLLTPATYVAFHVVAWAVREVLP